MRVTLFLGSRLDLVCDMRGGGATESISPCRDLRPDFCHVRAPSECFPLRSDRMLGVWDLTHGLPMFAFMAEVWQTQLQDKT